VADWQLPDKIMPIALEPDVARQEIGRLTSEFSRWGEMPKVFEI
jgi:hypothetical protein